MATQTVPYIPTFVIGAMYLIGPGLAVTFFTGSEQIGAGVSLLIAIAALVRAHDSWFLSSVLIALRTWPFIALALLAIDMRLRDAFATDWWRLVPPLLIGGLAQWRVRALLKTNQLEF